MWKKIEKYYRTVSYLKKSQVKFLVKNRLERKKKAITKASAPALGTLSLWMDRLDAHPDYEKRFDRDEILSGTVTLLHESGTPGGHNWANPDKSHLWNFNLQYLEFLIPLAAAYRETGEAKYYEKFRDYCLRWMEDNEDGTGDGWHPYTISLRLTNLWICMDGFGEIFQKDEEFAQKLGDSMYAQYLHLQKKLELHLLGNHYLENLKAVMLGALYFKEPGVYDDYKSCLREELEENLARGEQTILFLNRRGNSRMALCSDCGEAPTCPRCSVHLTYHSANGRLMCHYCGYSHPLPPVCPQCGGRFQFVGIGTQKLQEELQALYPDTEVMRMDADTVTATHSHEVLLDRFRRKKVPILLGTQMVAKGLDFPNVTLVGVVDGDLSLYADNYRAAERTFSLLTQVVGRAGRGDKPGRAVIQTWSPQSDVINLAARQDYDTFYRGEREMRRMLRFPPFLDLFRITISGPEESQVLRACAVVRRSLEPWIKPRQHGPEGPEVLGPAPAPVLKVNNRYRYRVLVKCRNGKEIRALLAQVLRAAQQDKANRGLSILMDVNPMD